MLKKNGVDSEKNPTDFLLLLGQMGEVKGIDGYFWLDVSGQLVDKFSTMVHMACF